MTTNHLKIVIGGEIFHARWSGEACSSIAGELAGNPFLTITENLARLAVLGREVLWNGSRDISFAEAITP
ncbi:MAG TPA: hypothetical protein VGI65_15455 [Steroidobacteraceae bacterium]